VIKEAFEKKDMDLIERLSVLLDRTKNRECKLNKISDKLHLGVGDLASYLEHMVTLNCLFFFNFFFQKLFFISCQPNLKIKADSQIFVPYDTSARKALPKNQKASGSKSSRESSGFKWVFFLIIEALL
jgi:hypothetical protein